MRDLGDNLIQPTTRKVSVTHANLNESPKKLSTRAHIIVRGK